MGVAKIADADLNGKGNIGKADTPGVTLSEMQRIMDEIPREVLVPKINAIIDDVNLKSVRAETYTKTETDTAINNKMIAIGAGDMAKSVYDPDGDGIVDDAEKLGGVSPNGYATAAQGAEADALVSGTTPAGNATKFGGALPAAYATAEQGAKADLLKAGLVYSTAEVETGEIGPTGKKWYRKYYTGTLPTIGSGYGTVTISLSGVGVTKGMKIEAGVWNASGGWQPCGYIFYMEGQEKNYSCYCFHSGGNITFNYGFSLSGSTYGIYFTYEK